MEFPTVNISASKRSLGKLMKGGKVRLQGGDLPLIIHPAKFNHITKCIMQGKGFHIALSPEEIHHNHAKGIFGKAADRFMEKHGIKDAAYKIGDIVKPHVKQLITQGTKAAATAASAYAPEFAPIFNKGADMIDRKAQAYLDHPDDEQAKYREWGNSMRSAPLKTMAKTAWDVGRDSGAGQDMLDAGSRYTGQDLSGMYSQGESMYRQARPHLDTLNEMSGQNMGSLDKASIGALAANYSLAKLEAMIQAKRASMLPAASQDTGSSGAPSKFWGHGLYGHGLYGCGLRPHRREKDSIGIMGNLVRHQSGGSLHPALMSQPYDANFQFASHLPPGFRLQTFRPV